MSERNYSNSMKKDTSMVKFPIAPGGKVCFGGRAHKVDVTSGLGMRMRPGMPRR